MRLNKDKDCRACFAKYCDCECKTCKAAFERNNKLSPTELILENLESALEAGEKS